MTRQYLTYLLFFISTFYFGQTWQWAATGNSAGTLAEGNAICLDLNSNVFITGSVPIVSFGTYTVNSGGTTGVYVAKYDATGNILWAKGSIGSGSDAGISLSSDSFGNVYVTGNFTSPTLTFDTYTLTNSGSSDIFIVKYDISGNVLWAKSAGGTNADYGTGVKADANGNAYLTGHFSSPIITFGTYTLTNIGTSNGYITKYDTNGNIIWANHFGNIDTDEGYAISIDTIGNVFLTGVYSSTAVAFGTYTLTNLGSGINVFLIKYNSNGSVIWAKNSIGTGFSTSICTDPNGNSYIAGTFISPTITFGSYSFTNSGNFNVFLVKYDQNGNVLWAKSGKGPYVEEAYSVACDANSVYMTGRLDHSLSFDSYTITPPIGWSDPMFIVRYDCLGNLNYFGAETGGGDDQNGICVDASCNAYITGDFIGNPFVLGSNTLFGSGYESIFVGKLSFTCLTANLEDLASKNMDQNIFPNPNNGSFKIQIDDDIISGQLILIDLFGQYIYGQNIIHGVNQINTNGLAQGLYNCILLKDNRKINLGRVIIE